MHVPVCHGTEACLFIISLSVFHQQRSPLALHAPGWSLGMRLLLPDDAKFLSLEMHIIDFISLPFTIVALSKTCLYSLHNLLSYSVPVLFNLFLL